LCRYETWSLTFKKEYRLKIFEHRVLRRITEPKRGEIIGYWRKLYNEELYNMYACPNIIRMKKSRRMRRIGNAARIRAKRNVYRALVETTEGKRPS
jgi:hypothetical protein